MADKTIKICDVCGNEMKPQTGYKVWEEDSILHITFQSSGIETTGSSKDVCSKRDLDVLIEDFVKVIVPIPISDTEIPW